MLSNRLIKLLLIYFFIHVSPNSTLALHENTSGHWQEPDELQTGSYLVIGVFKYEKNAQSLTHKAKQEGLKASYRFYANSGFYYVYTYSDSSKEGVLDFYHELRNKSHYHDAWILTVQEQIVAVIEKKATTEEPDTSTLSSASHITLESISEPKGVYSKPSDQMIVVFESFNQTSGDTVSTDIQLVDGQKSRLIEDLGKSQTWAFNKKDYALDTVQVIAQAIGYRKIQIDWNIADPLSDTANFLTHLKNDTLWVQLPLMELEKGDIQVMYNTYFYGNSTVMRIQSTYELDALYNALERNPGMRIKLHGHTNGSSRGLTYLYLEEKKNFFELLRTKEYRKKGVSSLKLSTYRAETIKSYLVNRGIASGRVETVGWGGAKMLFDPDSPMSKNNIRVEIEVLSK